MSGIIYPNQKGGNVIMVNRLELKEVLQNYLSLEQIDFFLNKKINNLCKRGNINNIEKILKVLQKYQLLNLIILCPSILAFGKSQEIESILLLLKSKNLLGLVNTCPYILAQGKIQEIENILCLLESKNLLGLVSTCPTILAQGKIQEIENILNILEDNNLLELVNICPSILAYGKSQVIKSILNLLKSKNLLGLASTCPTILAKGKIQKIENILNLLESKNLLGLLKTCPSILAFGKDKEIENILNLLESKNLLGLVSTCPTILAQGNSQKIKNILSLLKDKKLSGLVNACPSILAQGNFQEIKSILCLLEDHELLGLVSTCPTILAKGKIQEIENILCLLKSKNLLEVINVCPTILAQGNSHEIKRILNLLESKGLLGLVNTYPSILAFGNSQEIKKILYLLEKHNVDLELLSPFYYLLLSYSKVKSIFEHDRDHLTEEEFWMNVKIYLKLTNHYNRIYNQKQIIELSKTLKIDTNQLLGNIMEKSINLQEVLKSKGYVWIGDYISCTREQLQENQTLMIDVAETVAKSFIKKANGFNIDYSDLYDYVLDILINRCGNLLINTVSEENMRRALYNYLMKYCYQMIPNRKFVDYEKISNMKKYSSQDSYQEHFIQNYSFLTEEERYFLEKMSKYIELGEDYIKLLKETWNLTEQEIQEKIITIREKISSSNYLSDIGKSKYLKK